MQRWHIPFDYIDNHWTNTEFYHMVGAVIVSERQARSKSKGTYRVSPSQMENRHARS